MEFNLEAIPALSEGNEIVCFSPHFDQFEHWPVPPGCLTEVRPAEADEQWRSSWSPYSSFSSAVLALPVLSVGNTKSKLVLQFPGDCPSTLHLNDHMRDIPNYKPGRTASHLALVEEKMVSHWVLQLLSLVESLPASSIAEQTHPWADSLQQENEGIQEIICTCPKPLGASAGRNVVLLLTLLCIRIWRHSPLMDDHCWMSLLMAPVLSFLKLIFANPERPH